MNVGSLSISPTRVADLIDDVVRTGRSVDQHLDNAESLLAYALDETRLGDAAVRPMFERSMGHYGGNNVLFGAAQVQVPGELTGVLRDAVEHSSAATTQLSNLRTRVADWVAASDAPIDLATIDNAIADALTGARRINRVASDLAALTPTTPGSVTAVGTEARIGETRRYLYFNVALDGDTNAARAATSYGPVRRFEPAYRGNPFWVPTDGPGVDHYPNPLETPHFLGFYRDESSAHRWIQASDPADAMPSPLIGRYSLHSLPRNELLHTNPYVTDWYREVAVVDRMVALPSSRLDPATYPAGDAAAQRLLTDPDALRAPFERHLERTAEDSLAAAALRDRALDLDIVAARAERALQPALSGSDKFPATIVSDFEAALASLTDEHHRLG